jgi:hypothetical protein
MFVQRTLDEFRQIFQALTIQTSEKPHMLFMWVARFLALTGDGEGVTALGG